jgi:hypothetical protein
MFLGLVQNILVPYAMTGLASAMRGSKALDQQATMRQFASV